MYRSIYETNKRCYERLNMKSFKKHARKQRGGAKVVGTVDYDAVVKNVFESDFVNPVPLELITLHRLVRAKVNADATPDFTVLKVRSRGEGSYKDQRYDSLRIEDKCPNDNAVFIKNADDAMTYMEEIAKIYENTELSALETGVVLKPEEWVSFNWTISKPPGGDKFIFRAGNMNVVGSTEFGVKHTMLGGHDDLYFAGEGAIVVDKARNKRYVQFNLNSSSWDVNPLVPKFEELESKEVPEDVIKQYISFLIKKVMTAIVATDSVYSADRVITTDVQVSHIDAKFTDRGELDPANTFYAETLSRKSVDIPYDPAQGILSYYKTPSCPDDEFVKGAAAYKKVHARTYELTQQTKLKDKMIVDVGNMRFSFVKGEAPRSVDRPNNLENFDDLFIDYLRGFKGGLPQTGVWKTTFYDSSDRVTKKLKELNTNDLGRALASYDSVGCKEVNDPHFKITTSNDEYMNTKPFKVQGKGSGAFIISHGANKVVKGNHFKTTVPQNVEDPEFQTKYATIAEMWINDYLKRKIIDTNISHNIATPTDIFICDKKFNVVDDPAVKSPVKRDFKTKYTDVATPTNRFGYVAMELLENTISDAPYLSFGSIFEYMYAKFTVCQETGIIFTDQANTGNCGYIKAPYCRSYTLTDAKDGSSIKIYVKDPLMIKMMDLESFEFTVPEEKNNFFYTESDVSSINMSEPEKLQFADLSSKLNNQIEMKTLQGLIMTKFMDPKNSVVSKLFSSETYNVSDFSEYLTFEDKRKQFNGEQMGTLMMMYLLILAFFNNTQCKDFMSIVKATVPAEYLVKPDGVEIRDFSYTIPVPPVRVVVKKITNDYDGEFKEAVNAQGNLINKTDPEWVTFWADLVGKPVVVRTDPDTDVAGTLTAYNMDMGGDKTVDSITVDKKSGGEEDYLYVDYVTYTL